MSYPYSQSDLNKITETLQMIASRREESVDIGGAVSDVMKAADRYDFQNVSDLIDPKVRETKKTLSDLRKAIADTLSVKGQLGKDAETELQKHSVEILGHLEDLEVRLPIVLDAIDKSLDSLPTDRGGRPANKALDNFVGELANIYKKNTKAAPTRSYDAINEIAGGDFFDFVCCAILPFDYERSSQSLDPIIRKVVSAYG